jgi:peptide chain release factor subunit 1
VIDGSPFIEPLADMAAGGDWCVLLANRREARIFRGSRERLEEVGRVHDDVHGQHDQGGWSQARYQRSVDNEATHHLKRSAEAVLRRFHRTRFDNLLVGAPEEAYAKLENELHPYLRERLRGRVEVDVENTTVEDVFKAARPAIDRYELERQDELLGRLREGVGAGGRGAAGLDGVLGALNERRVEALLLDDTFSAPGVECPHCGWIGSDTGLTECPADGGELERRGDVGERAVERALMQDAEVVVLHDRPDLRPHGGIGAVLRF